MDYQQLSVVVLIAVIAIAIWSNRRKGRDGGDGGTSAGGDCDGGGDGGGD